MGDPTMMTDPQGLCGDEMYADSFGRYRKADDDVGCGNDGDDDGGGVQADVSYSIVDGTFVISLDVNLIDVDVTAKAPGTTVQLGVALNGGTSLSPGGSLFFGLTVDSDGDVATYAGGGLGLTEGAGVSLGLQLAGSNAPNVCALGGGAYNVSGTAGFGPGGTIDYFQSPNGNVRGAGGTFGVAGGGDASVQGTWTLVTPLGNYSCVDGKLVGPTPPKRIQPIRPKTIRKAAG
jgi:hypothetical protein